MRYTGTCLCILHYCSIQDRISATYPHLFLIKRKKSLAFPTLDVGQYGNFLLIQVSCYILSWDLLEQRAQFDNPENSFRAKKLHCKSCVFQTWTKKIQPAGIYSGIWQHWLTVTEFAEIYLQFIFRKGLGGLDNHCGHWSLLHKGSSHQNKAKLYLAFCWEMSCFFRFFRWHFHLLAYGWQHC